MILYKLLKLWKGWVEVGWGRLKQVEVGIFLSNGLKQVEIGWSGLKLINYNWPTKRTGPNYILAEYI